MSKCGIFQLVTALICSAGLVLAGCGSAEIKEPGTDVVTPAGEGETVEPAEEQPVETPEEQPEEQPAEQPEEAPEEGETELEKQAKKEIAQALASANELAAQKKFGEAPAELLELGASAQQRLV